MYYSAKNLYQGKVNFSEVLKVAVSKRRLIRAFAYVIRADVGAEKEFFEALHKIGFEVKEKDLQIFYGGAKKGDWDVGLCMDVIRLLPKIDVMVLISGDGDYTELLKYAKSQGVKTEIISFGRTTSKMLIDEAEEVVDMSEDVSKFLIGAKKENPKSPYSSSRNPEVGTNNDMLETQSIANNEGVQDEQEN